MSDMARTARAAMKAKAHRLAGEKVGKVDSTSVDLPKAFGQDQTGETPQRRKFKSGGLVTGDKEKPNIGKRPARAAGGPPITPPVGNPMVGAAKNMAQAQATAGVPNAAMNLDKAKGMFGSGLKKGGMAKRGKHADGGSVDNDADDRLERKSGGRTGKGKTEINIIIGAKGAQAPTDDPSMTGMVKPPFPPNAGPQGPVPQPAPPPGAMPPGAPPPMPMPPPGAGGPPPMMRKRGGAVMMKAGSGGGEGRLEKTKKYGLAPPR